MGWLVKKRETKKNGVQYKIWTTISDSWITEKWMSKEEIVKFFFWYRFDEFVRKFLEDSMTFPNGYTEKDSYQRILIDEKSQDEWFDFIRKTFNEEDGNEIKFKKFIEELNKIGITLDVFDEKYKISNLE